VLALGAESRVTGDAGIAFDDGSAPAAIRGVAAAGPFTVSDRASGDALIGDAGALGTDAGPTGPPTASTGADAAADDPLEVLAGCVDGRSALAPGLAPIGDGALREGASVALLVDAAVGFDADGTRAPCPLLDSRAIVVAATTVSTPASPDAPIGAGALGVRGDRDDADGVALPSADARDAALGRRTPNAAPAAADMPPDAAAVPTCAAFFTGAAAADTA
jgi:hypothetical protein